MRNIITILFLFPIICLGQIAFPTAKGFGRNATGGAGGDVYHVTNLNDSGAGSLRNGIDRVGVTAGQPRTIVFDVGGDIFITGIGYIISAGLDGDLTIAGETAPFPGITIRGDNNSDDDCVTGCATSALMDIRASNVIIRYISFRTNDGNRTDYDALRIRGGASGVTDIIIDHCSISNGSDENFATTEVTNSTVQNSMLYDSDTTYNYLFGNDVFNHSFINNYLSHTDQRNVLVGYGRESETSEFINNVIYGYGEGMAVVYGNITDVLGNVYKAFPSDPPNDATITWQSNQFNNPDGVVTDGDFYFTDNYLLNPQGKALYNGNVATYNNGSRVITNSLFPSWETTQTAIENSVFDQNVGNSLHRDSMDAQAIADYTNGTGSYSSLSVPNKTLATRPVGYDTDNDGMSDAWETQRGLNPNLADNNGDDDSDGYTNLQEFLFFMAGEDNIDSGNGGTSEGVTAQTGRKTGNAILISN